jgi:hypothetical protein
MDGRGPAPDGRRVSWHGQSLEPRNRVTQAVVDADFVPRQEEVEIMRVLRVVSTIAVAVLLAAMAASPASAAVEPGAVLNLSWSAPAASNQVFTTTLTCHPTGGGEEWYMDAEAACGDLTVAGGDFEALPGRPLGCEGVQGWAIRTTATGHWFGQSVNYDELHANWCEARKKLGWVFIF